MAREPALCALPPRHASRNNIAAVTARRLFTRMCSCPPLPDQAVAVGLRFGTVDPQNTFSDREVAVGLSYGKANTKTPRPFARLDPVFAHDNSGRSVLCAIKEESTRLLISSPFSKRPNKKGPPRERPLLPPARAPLQKMPTGSTDPAWFFSTLTHMFSGYVCPCGTGRISDTARRASGDATASSLVSWMLFP